MDREVKSSVCHDERFDKLSAAILDSRERSPHACCRPAVLPKRLPPVSRSSRECHHSSALSRSAVVRCSSFKVASRDATVPPPTDESRSSWCLSVKALCSSLRKPRSLKWGSGPLAVGAAVAAPDRLSSAIALSYVVRLQRDAEEVGINGQGWSSCCEAVRRGGCRAATGHAANDSDSDCSEPSPTEHVLDHRSARS